MNAAQGLGFDFGGALSNIVKAVASKIPEIGIGAIAQIASAKLADKLAPKAPKAKAAPAAKGAPEAAGDLMLPAARAAGLPKWVVPVAIGGVALLGVVGFLAFRRKS